MSAPTPSKNPAFKPVRLQHVMREVRRPVFVKPDTRYTEIGVRSHGRGVFHKEPITGEDLGNKRVFWLKPGTLVFNIVFAWERAVAVLSDDEAGLIASHRFPTYEMLPGRAHAGFMKHYFTTGYGHYLLRLNSPGAAGRNKTLNQSALMKEEVWLPPAETQRAIADFLDRKTAAIDALIRKKERLLELLAEQRAALIHRAVTRGLDPDAEMKDSGVEWIGEVPAHWEVRPSRYLVDANRRIMYGIVLPGPHSEGGIPVVKANNCRPERLVPERMKCTTVDIEARYARSRLVAGDVVIAIRGSVGSAAIVPPELEGANLTQDAARLSPSSKLSSRWLWYLTMSPWFTGYLRPRISGSTVKGVNIWDLARVPLPDVPVPEQGQIAAHLDARLAPLERAMTATAESTSRLREYRQALITAAVTGQLDLSSEAAA